MTDNSQHQVPGSAAGDGRIVKLTSQEVEDARRLLSLLASSDERTTIEPPARRDTAGLLSKQSLLARAQQVIANRRRRHDIFGAAMFGEPAWDMLLSLYSRDTGERQTLSRLSELAGTTKTTALRSLDYLEKEQLVTREAHPTHRRAAFIHLTNKGRNAVELYLSETIGSGG